MCCQTKAKLKVAKFILFLYFLLFSWFLFLFLSLFLRCTSCPGSPLCNVRLTRNQPTNLLFFLLSVEKCFASASYCVFSFRVCEKTNKGAI